jgi:hypothetical protein
MVKNQLGGMLTAYANGDRAKYDGTLKEFQIVKKKQCKSAVKITVPSNKLCETGGCLSIKEMDFVATRT